MMKVSIGASLHQSPGQRVRAYWILLATWAACLLGFPMDSTAAPTVLYTFTVPAFPNILPVTNRDGLAPASKLVLASDGNLYGTTSRGGTHGAGSIFRVSSSGGFSNIYSFPPGTNNSGEVVYDLGPNDLVQGTNGNFYGTTLRGGSNFTGMIFEISPSGAFTEIHTFAPLATNSLGRAINADGMSPLGALALGADGNFYGTTQFGGSNNTGTIFQLTHAGIFTSLHTFSPSIAGLASTNGVVPNALVFAANYGAFYGTTRQGGLDNAGTFFKFSTTGGFTQIYSFNGAAPGNSPITPVSALVPGSDGNFYGTSAYGGSQGGGAVFAITNTGGANLLHSFPQLNAGISSTLTLGADGNFYGTTAANGLGAEGSIFRITPAGGFGAYYFSPLNTNSENPDGADPSAALTADSAGNLYGTSLAGGTNGSGLVFQIVGPDFNPPYFSAALTNPPPALTNVPVGASVTLSYTAQGFAPLTYQWLRNGAILTDGQDIMDSQTNTLLINPVFPRDVGSYALRISNTWGAVTSSVTILTVTPPGIAILSPAPNARTNSPLFAGNATNAPFTNLNPGVVRLTNVIFTISNTFLGSNITGLAPVTAGAAGASNWTFSVTPFPGTNILSVQSQDVSGNISPVASQVFFYQVPARLTVHTSGSGTGTFSITNDAMLDIGQSYSNTAAPVSSVFSNWISDGLVSYDPTLPFIMQSNLVLTADFIARQPPAIFITSPAAGARTNSPLFKGTATPSPLLAGVNPNNIRLTNVVYWLTNTETGSVLTGLAELTAGTTASNWSFAATPLPGTNILAVQCADASGDFSAVVAQTFFYEVPAQFKLLQSGTGNGTFTATASFSHDTLPSNGAMLNVDENYTITAIPAPFSTFGQWVSPTGTSANSTLSFVMQPGFTATATFNAIPPSVAISSPTPNQSTAAPVFIGTASGHYRITNVSYTLANSFAGSVSNGSATLTGGAGPVSNWSFLFNPLPGTNALTVRCQDVLGDTSPAVSLNFFYEVPAPLTVTNAGRGSGVFTLSTSGGGGAVFTNGAKLKLGEGYIITASPDNSSLFSNWLSSAGPGFGGNSPALPFVMQSNLVLTVTLIPNFFPGAAGTYNGLFFPSNAVAAENSGMLYNLVLLNSGAFSARILTDGTNYHVATNFDASGQAAFPAGPLEVALSLDPATLKIGGTVSTPQWTANLSADLASSAPASQEYTMLFSPSAALTPDSPPGDGYVLATNVSGTLTLIGALADGTSYSQTVPVSRTADLPLYASLYTNSPNTSPGLLLGWINLTNLQAAAPANTLAWIKKSSHAPGLYTNGFTNTLSVRGSLWTNPPGNSPAVSLTNGQLVASNSSFLLTFTNISVNGNILTNLGALPTNYLSGSINPGTGLLTVTLVDGNTTNKAVGAVLQNSTNAGGFFLTPTNAGAIDLQP